ncbi:acetoacetate-CoA ligase [Peniophora sp. CONT]|nr:acetoacetate-CoA ligase [Peniophora sp. CONT]
MSSEAWNDSRLLWDHPAPQLTRMDGFRRLVNRKHGLDIEGYDELHQYSVSNYDFWGDLWEYLGIIYSIRYTKVLEEGPIKEVPTWFPGARLNYAENMLWRNDDAVAITERHELGDTQSYSFRQLRELVRQMSTALRSNGLKAGDRVAAIVANNANAVVLALSIASIGAIFSSTGTDMGVKGLLDRYRQIEPKFLFAETEALYSGKKIDQLPKVAQVVDGLKDYGLQRVVLLHSPSGQEASDAATRDIPLSVKFSAFIHSDDGSPLIFEQLPFDQPLFILYSSGTTGVPKCIVHSAGGVLIQTKKDIHLHLDISMNDTYFQFTTAGWMMWPYMLAGLSCGARLVLYDGSPFYPDVQTYLKFIDEQGVNAFGTSPRFLSELQARVPNPLEIGSFDALRVITVIGAVFTVPLFEWVHHAFGKDKLIASASGGTDICGCFVICSPLLPNHSGDIQCKGLGMKVEVFDSEGRNIDETGEAGELVCTRPHPSIPVKFWGDDERGSRFLAAYYDVYPGIWRHGDFIAKNPKTGGLRIYGRSDGVLNPSGIRFGSGEIYTVLERFADVIDDSICVGQQRPGEEHERVLLFLKLRSGHALTPELEKSVRLAIREALSPRHVPTYVLAVDDIPYTVNGKKIEVAVKKIVSGKDVQPNGSVANPEAFTLYTRYRNLK